MNIYEIETIVRSETIHNGGFTLFFERSVQSLRSKQPYIVGAGLHGFKIDSDTLYRGSFATILEGYIETWKRSESYYDGFGSWLDPESGTTYIDPITVHSNLAYALNLAKLRGEKCIWNQETSQAINV